MSTWINIVHRVVGAVCIKVQAVGLLSVNIVWMVRAQEPVPFGVVISVLKEVTTSLLVIEIASIAERI